MLDYRSSGQEQSNASFLPPSVFLSAAANGTLLAVKRGNSLLAYALFALPRSEVRLTHLVVAESAKGRGIARALIEEISRIHSDRIGIRAKCRRDYGLDDMWLHLGFQPINEVPGRSRDKKPLVVWHRKHSGHIDLFSYKEEPVLRAAIDFNVLRDLYDFPIRKGGQESHALIADHLAGVLDLVVTSALQEEISTVEDNLRRSLYRRKAHANHEYAPPEAKSVERCMTALTSHIQRRHPDYPCTEQDRADIKHVAAAAAAGLTVFTTRDEALITTCYESALEEFDLRILRPADVVIRIDELTRSDAYRPATLQGTGYTTATIASGGESEIEKFRNADERERSQDFLRRLRGLSSARHGEWERIVVRDPDGLAVAVFACGRLNDRLEIPLFRVDSKHPLAATLTQQVLTELRRRCVNSGTTALAITDGHAGSYVRRAALFDGFFESSGGLCALAINECGTVSQIREMSERQLLKWDIAWEFPPKLNLSPIGVAELESVLWPAKITNSRLSSYMIPIQPRWSMDLFGVPETLPYTRPDALGISREHVYYRSPHGIHIKAPSRILWYMSQGQGRERREAAVIACSLLDEVVTAPPSDLHERYRHLGVFELKHIQSVAKEGKAQAIRFTRTEVFEKPLAGKALKEFLSSRRFKLPLLSVRPIESDLFIAAYRKGCHGD